MRALIERALRELADDLARSMEQKLVKAIARELSGAEDASPAGGRATRIARRTSAPAASTPTSAKRRPTTRAPARTTAAVGAKSSSGLRAGSADTSAQRTAVRPPLASPKDLEAPLLTLLASGSETPLAALLQGVGIEPGERWRLQRALASLRSAGRVVLVGERRTARYRLATTQRAESMATPGRGDAVAKAVLGDEEPVAAAAPEVDDDALDLPVLRAHAHAGAVVVVGGLVEPDALDALRASTGLALEWVGLPIDEAAEVAAQLAERVHAGKVAALVVLDALVTGAIVGPIADAARDVALAVAFAGTGGGASLRQALIELDERLAGA